MKTNTEVITKRLDPCGCGCLGQDSWHRATYRRVVRDIVVQDGTTDLFYAKDYPFDATGVAKFPWGTSRVVRTYIIAHDGGRICLGWAVDMDAALEVQNA